MEKSKQQAGAMFFYEPNGITTIKLLLRRTPVLLI
jgi:hypothetical protein